MMGIFASATDVDDRYEGTLDDDQRQWVEVRIEDAESLLMTQIPRLAQVNLPAIDQLNAKRVVCDAVLRVLRNPGGWQQETETVGPFNRQRTRSTDLASGGLLFTDAELALFGKRKRRAGMMGVRRPWFTE